MTTLAGARGRRPVAASILAVLIVGVYFSTSRGEAGALPAEFLITATVLAVAFWFPAMRIGAPGDVLAGGFSLLAWLIAWTAVWDLAVSGVARTRTLFQDWWIVYPIGVVTLGLLLALHGAVVRGRGNGSEEEQRGENGQGDAHG